MCSLVRPSVSTWCHTAAKPVAQGADHRVQMFSPAVPDTAGNPGWGSLQVAHTGHAQARCSGTCAAPHQFLQAASRYWAPFWPASTTLRGFQVITYFSGFAGSRANAAAEDQNADRPPSPWMRWIICTRSWSMPVEAAFREHQQVLRPRSASAPARPGWCTTRIRSGCLAPRSQPAWLGLGVIMFTTTSHCE